jgi:ketosteroid isomerase-like protein
MSQENVEVVQHLHDKWGEGDLPAGAEFYDPRVQFIPLATLPDTAEALYVGPEGIRKFMHGWLKAWTDLTVSAEEIIEAGDSVVVVVRQRAVGKESGVPSDVRLYEAWTFRGRAVIRREQFADRTDALEAVGLSGQDAPADS